MTHTPETIGAATACKEEEEWLPRCDISTPTDHIGCMSFPAKEEERQRLDVLIAACHTPSTSRNVKEEVLSALGYRLDFDISTPHIKGEPLTAKEHFSRASTPTDEHLPQPDFSKTANHEQPPSINIKEEPLSAEQQSARENHFPTSNVVQSASFRCEGNITYSNLSTPSGPIQYTAVRIKEEAFSSDEEDLTSSDTSHLQDSSLSSTVMEELQSREVDEEDGLQPEGVTSYVSNPGKSDTPPPTEKVFFCYECDSCFNSKSELVRHQRGHTGQKPYSCPECGKGFTTSSYLMKHRRIHSGDKPFTCSECGKSFTHKADLVIHSRTHTGEKPFSCSECRKSFISQSYLIKHQRSHTGYKQYSCSECGKSFGTNTYLVIHQRIHTGEKPFSCSECGKCFISDSYLNRHMRVHTGEKPFSCTQCGKRFASNSQLCNHRKSHSEERPYFCFECGKGFTWRAKLIRHQKIHAGGGNTVGGPKEVKVSGEEHCRLAV